MSATGLTPTQIQAIERWKAFRAHIAEQASKLIHPETKIHYIPNTPYGVPKHLPKPPRQEVSQLSPIPDNLIREACETLAKLDSCRGPRIETIQQVVAKYYGVSRREILSERRFGDIVKPRQVSMYLARVLTSRSLPEIGRRTGGRDHTTAIHAVQKIARLIETDPELASDIAALKAEIG